MEKSNKMLKIASVLEILIGIISIVVIRFFLVQDNTIVILAREMEVTALWSLVLIYGINIFKILAGIIGLSLSKKKSALTVLCGIILVVAHCTDLLIGEITVMSVVVVAITFIIPLMYFFGSINNFKTK